MRIEQIHWADINQIPGTESALQHAQLVLCTGGIDVVGKDSVFPTLRKLYPDADIVSLSTAGEIAGTHVYEQSIIINALQFEKTNIRSVSLELSDFQNSFDCGLALADKLRGPSLCHILVISDGTLANGDELVKGINQHTDKNVIVTGGLAADAGRFTGTLVGLNHTARAGLVVAIGFYGKDLIIKHGSRGGWDEFGPVREVTKSQSNKLYSLDHIPALDLYKKFLGEKASELPASALLFPLCLKLDNGEVLVRTILSIDENEGSMTFAGDVPQGSQVQFMMANFDRLIDGAYVAASESKDTYSPQWVFLVSCVGRKLVLAHRTEEEIEAVVETLGKQAIYSGFYSNGEISPLLESTRCSLHNQTMTITTYVEL